MPALVHLNLNMFSSHGLFEVIWCASESVLSALFWRMTPNQEWLVHRCSHGQFILQIRVI